MTNQMKQFYFDELVWSNIMGFVDIKPVKQDTFVVGTYSIRAPLMAYNAVVKIVGRTPCFVKLETDTYVNRIKSVVASRTKIFIKDGVEFIKVRNVKITAHDNEQYRFATKTEWALFRNQHTYTPSERVSDTESESETESETESESESDTESDTDSE